MKKQIIIAYIFFVFFGKEAYCASENLDEMAVRKDRIANAVKGKDYLEDFSTLVWQPETFIYNDITTGHEVTKINASFNIRNSLPDIGWAHFSADGKRFAFGSHRDTSACDSSDETNTNSSYQGTVMIVRTDGTYLRPADNAPFEVYVHSRFHHWSPVEPDIYYGFGRNFGGEGLNNDALYRVEVADISISKNLILDLGTGSESTIERAISSKGTKLLAMSAGRAYAITLSNGGATLDDPDGWSTIRQLDDYWGGTPSDTSYSFHETPNLVGPDGEWFYFNSNGFTAWWRMRLSGSAADEGPFHIVDNAAPYNWGGELEPVINFGSNGDSCDAANRSPWNCDSDNTTGDDRYLSHAAFDRWGVYVAGGIGGQCRCYGVWDIEAHNWFQKDIAAARWNNHYDWEAWSDYFASSPSGVNVDNFIYAIKYDGTDTIKVSETHIREMGSTDYNSNARVSQSPDGTKLIYHSDFLSGTADNWDLYQAVAYYPYPPEVTSCSASDGTVTIRFDWQNANADLNPRTYTSRGWPDSSTDDRPIPRETANYRLWRSTDNSTWDSVGLVDAEHFSRFDFANGGFKSGQKSYWEIRDATVEEGETYYYGITSIEHSGLESRSLSNIFKITISGGSGSGAQAMAYPANPGGDSGFHEGVSQLKLPKAPPKLIVDVANKENGHYNLTWTEPVNDKSLIRYYNIYYSTESGDIMPVQQNRIASVPVNTPNEAADTISWLDWCADKENDGYYKLTSVDTQGNESGLVNVKWRD